MGSGSNYATTPYKGNHLSRRVIDRYTKAARVTIVLNENIEYTVNRRWCLICKKITTAQPPGISKYARRSANHQATLVSLHMSGLSHVKAAEFSSDARKCPVSRSTSHRDKMTFRWKLTTSTTASPGTS